MFELLFKMETYVWQYLCNVHMIIFWAHIGLRELRVER